MSKVVTLTEAASIAIHSIILIAKTGEGEYMNVQDIARRTGASRHHVAKVLQRLVKENYLASVRGPNGGFRMKADPEQVSMLEVFECIEGKLDLADCPMDKPICPFDKCLMGNIVSQMTNEFREYMAGKKLAEYL